MNFIQKDTLRTTIISYLGILLGYINRGFLFLIILTEEQIGLAGLLLTIGVLFANISGFGVAFTTVKFLPFFKDFRRHHYGFFPFIFRMVVWGCIITSLIFFVFRSFIEQLYIEKSEAFVTYYWWLYPIGLGYVFYLLFEAYLRGFYKNTISIFAQDIVYRLAITFFLLIYWAKWISFDVFIELYSLVYFVPPLILLYVLIKNKEFILSRKHINISKRFRRLIIQFSAYNYVNSLGKSLVVSLDVMMIAQMIGLGETGIYATVTAFVSVMLIPSRSLTRVSTPLVSDYWQSRNMTAMQSLYQKTSAVSLFLTLSGFLFVWLNIDLLFSFLNPTFHVGIWVFLTLMLGRFFEIFFDLTEIIFATSKKYKYDIYMTIGLVIFVFVLNLLFIPKWGIIGAAASTSIAWIIFTTGRFLFVYKAYGLNPFHKNQLFVLGFALLTVFLGEWLGGMAPNFWVRALIVSPIFLFVFLIPIFVLKLVPQINHYISEKIHLIQNKLKR